MQPSAVRPQPMYHPEQSKPVKDSKYLAWIRTLPCAICRRKSEAAHTGGRGLSQKASDRRAIPLCALHHADYHRGRKRFEKTYQLDIEALILKLNEKPFVRIIAGEFVAILGGEEYRLGPVRKPVASAVKHAVEICRERPLNVRL
jgi:hypothetical protein